MRKLSPELIALVHHVKLYESGWWDEALRRLLITIIWLSPREVTDSEIKTDLKKNFDVYIESNRLADQLNLMVESQDIIFSVDKKYLISEKCKKVFEDELKQYADLEIYAKSKFFESLAKYDRSLNDDDLWVSFHDKCLYPLIDNMGAKFFELIGGVLAIHDNNTLLDFTKCYPETSRLSLKAAIIEFINPDDPKIRSYILRQLNASFYVKAGNLKESDIQKLQNLKDKKLQLTLFIDTNLLFSILNLHDNPANDAAHELMEIIKKIKKSMNISLYISPETAEEAKQVINYHNDQLKDFRCSKRLVNAARTRTDLSGFAIKYFERCANSSALIDPDEYFEPYVKNLISTIRPSGIELYNDKSFENYGTRQDVVDDILMELEFEKKHHPGDPKTYERLRHDIVLWHFVKDQRPSYIESPLDCQQWVVTVDFQFLGFDNFKRKGSSETPLCVHPTTLIQILQLWIPRSQEFEGAIVKSLRMPFLMGEFNANSEKTTLGILKALSRYENIDDLDESTITAILINDTLRQQFGEADSADKQGQLVREAILSEYKIMKEKVANAEVKTAALNSAIDEKSNEITSLQKMLGEQGVRSETQTKELSGRIDSLTKERDALNNELMKMKSNIEGLIDAKQKDDLAQYRRKELMKFFVLFPIVPIGLSIICSAAICYFLKQKNIIFWLSTVFLFMISIYILVTSTITQKNSKLVHYGPFMYLIKFRKWLFGVILSGIALAFIIKWFKLN